MYPFCSVNSLGFDRVLLFPCIEQGPDLFRHPRSPGQFINVGEKNIFGITIHSNHESHAAAGRYLNNSKGTNDT